MTRVQAPPRGLPAVESGRRRRLGFPNIPPRFWLWVGIVIAVWAILYWKINQEKLESWRNKILARQRAVAAELVPRFTPLRDQMEQWVLQSAGPYPGDFISAQAKQSRFRSQPGVYLRLFIDDATSVELLRKEAMESLRDGFTSCLMRVDNPDPWSGPPCKFRRDCPEGQHCNETLHCSKPAQPYNLRVGYRAMRVLYDDWVGEVRTAGDDLRLRLLDRDLDSAVQDDIPQMIDLMTRAKYFLLVLDEPADAGVEVPDAGTRSESLQAVAHPARVMLWDLETKKPLVRVRATVTAEVGAPSEPRVRLAVHRQANNCALALHVLRVLGLESDAVQ